MADLALSLALGTVATLTFAALLVVTAQHHGRFSMDTPGGVQKVHLQPVPRIGGIGIFLGLWVAAASVEDEAVRQIVHTLLIAGLPALLGGLLEDMTKRVGVGPRLAATFASGLLACGLSGTAIVRLDMGWAQPLLQIAPLAVVFTAFCVAGVANAINIIDGFHGLASGTLVLALAAIGTIAALAGDTPLAAASALVAACATGFLLINFPWGKLFLGDGGAYFGGFALAWLAVLLPARNAEVSPWASLLVCSYPVIEVLYSMGRRVRERRSASRPDSAHLHSLVAARLVQPRTIGWSAEMRNAAVSTVMWACAAVPAVLAVLLHNNTRGLVAVAGACLLLYHCLYQWVKRP